MKEPSQADKAIMWSRNKPLTAEELGAFGRERPKPPRLWPVASVKRGRDGKPTVEVGVKGTF